MNKIFLVTILTLATLFTTAFTNKGVVVIKTTIYCDHCKECESCGGRLDKELYNEKGISDVKVNYEEMTITVTYNPKKTSPDKIRQAISKLGYDADDVKADPAGYKSLDGCCKKP